MDIFFLIKQWIWLRRVDSFPTPSNDAIKKLLIGVNLIIIKDVRVPDNKKILRQADIRLDDPENINRFWELFKVRDDSELSEFVMCLAEYEIKFYSNRKRIATFGYLKSLIRYEKWNSDAELVESERLLDFLVSKGLRSADEWFK